MQLKLLVAFSWMDLLPKKFDEHLEEQAVRREEASLRHDARPLDRRPAGLGAVRRPLLRRGDGLPGGACLGTRRRNGQKASADRVICRINSLN